MELLAALVLVSVIMLVLFTVFNQTTDLVVRNREVSDVHRRSSRCMEIVADDLRNMLVSR